MGITSSHPYEAIEVTFANPVNYVIYSYQGSNFLLTRRNIEVKDFPDEITIRISELRLVDKTDKFLSEVYIDDADRVYVPLENDIIKNVPFFEVYRHSEYIYLGHLYSTKSRTGKFYESLIASIGRDISAKGIWLFDASRGGKCKKFSLSLQLFVSKDDKQYKTYYETLGYELINPESKKERAKLIHMIKTGKVFTVKEYINGIQEYLEVIKNTEYENIYEPTINYLKLNGVLKVIIDLNNDLSLNLIEYINDLINNGKCLEAQCIVNWSGLRETNYPIEGENMLVGNFREITRLLRNTATDEYIKIF